MGVSQSVGRSCDAGRKTACCGDQREHGFDEGVVKQRADEEIHPWTDTREGLRQEIEYEDELGQLRLDVEKASTSQKELQSILLRQRRYAKELAHYEAELQRFEVTLVPDGHDAKGQPRHAAQWQQNPATKERLRLQVEAVKQELRRTEDALLKQRQLERSKEAQRRRRERDIEAHRSAIQAKLNKREHSLLALKAMVVKEMSEKHTWRPSITSSQAVIRWHANMFSAKSRRLQVDNKSVQRELRKTQLQLQAVEATSETVQLKALERVKLAEEQLGQMQGVVRQLAKQTELAEMKASAMEERLASSASSPERSVAELESDELLSPHSDSCNSLCSDGLSDFTATDPFSTEDDRQPVSPNRSRQARQISLARGQLAQARRQLREAQLEAQRERARREAADAAKKEAEDQLTSMRSSQGS